MSSLIQEGSAFESIARLNIKRKSQPKARVPSPFDITDKIYKDMRRDTKFKLNRLNHLYRRSPFLFKGEALADLSFDDIPSLNPVKDETTATLEKIMEREK